MKKLLFSTLLLSFSIVLYGQNKQIEEQNVKNLKLLKELESPSFWVLNAELDVIDTIKNEGYRVSLRVDYDMIYELQINQKKLKYNFFAYQDNELIEAGQIRERFGDKIGTWYYFTPHHYLELKYQKDKVRHVDTIVDPDEPEIILLIDTFYTYAARYPVVLYNRETGKKEAKLYKEDLEMLKAKEEEEYKDAIQRLGLRIGY